MKNIIEECYKESIDLLISNSTPYGMLASSKSMAKNGKYYDSIFARDAAICSLGMALSKNKKLIRSAEKSLLNLANFQARNGEIPYFIKPEIGKKDFWYVGNIDSSLWWLIAIKFFDRHVKPDKTLEKRLSKNIAGAINWLEAQEHPIFCLLSQNEASDWADIMPRSGYTLYSNSLWYWVKKLYSLNDAKETKNSFNYLLYPWQKIPDNYYKKVYRAKRLVKSTKASREKQDYYLSFINYLFCGEDADVFGNTLAIMAGLTGQRLSRKIISGFIKLKKKKLLPIPALFKPIEENSKLWRDYMIVHKQNFPYQYHNGGVWPFSSCFWSIVLAKTGKRKEAEEELEKIAKANFKNNWQFNEWLSPKTGQPMGMNGQSWNAGAFLLAYWYLKGKVKI
jgi:hypothetical protein